MHPIVTISAPTNEWVEIFKETLKLASENEHLNKSNSDELEKWISSREQMPVRENIQELDTNNLENPSVGREEDDKLSGFTVEKQLKQWLTFSIEDRCLALTIGKMHTRLKIALSQIHYEDKR